MLAGSNQETVFAEERLSGDLVHAWKTALIQVDDAPARQGNRVYGSICIFGNRSPSHGNRIPCRRWIFDKSDPLMFGHTLEDQIGGQLVAGFVMTGLFEDSNPDNALSEYMATYIATRAVKPPISQ